MGLFETGQGNQKTRDEIGFGSSTFPRIINRKEEIEIEQGPTIIEHASVTGSAIYGSSVFGIYGTSTYGSSSGGTFIFGHPDFGVFGTSVFGSGSSTITFAVTNPNNTFIERFGFDYFEDSSNTTADWDTSNQWLLFASGEVAQSDSIFLNNVTVVTATFTCGFDTGDSGDLTCELSADGGSNWETATIGTQHTFTNTGDDLRFKLTASDAVKLIWIKVRYNG